MSSLALPSSDDAKSPAPTYSVKRWSGELDGAFSLNRSAYTTRAVAIAVDVARPVRDGELDGELRYDRESIKLDNSPAQLEKDRYDANLKYKRFWAQSTNYTYVSPRVRGDKFGFYQRAQGIRVGAGRRIADESETWELNLEAGSGYRVAHIATDEDIAEVLYILTAKARWAINDNVVLKLNWIVEASDREGFQILSLGLRNKLSDRLGLKYELRQQRTYANHAETIRDKEFQADVGLSYAF